MVEKSTNQNLRLCKLHKILTFIIIAVLLSSSVKGNVLPSTVSFSAPQFSQILYVGNSSVTMVTLSSTISVNVLHANMTWLWMPKTTVFQSRERNFALLEPQIIHFDIMAPSSIGMGRYKYFFTAFCQTGSDTFTVRSADYE